MNKKSMSLSSKLKNEYFDITLPGSYSGLSSFMRGKKVNVKKVKQWISEQDAYTLHKTPRRNFPRRKIIVSGIDAQWQADLMDLSSLKKHNKGYIFILAVIDVFSKVAWVTPLKQKTGIKLIKGFNQILKKSKRRPQKLQTDKGTEFLNKSFQSYLKKKKIHFFVTQNNDIKAAICERFIRTIKQRMWRYFTKHNTFRYIDILDDLVDSYNHTYHSSIKRPPITVNFKNQQDVWLTLYGNQQKIEKPIYKVGDKVRLSSSKLKFQKGYLPAWTQEIFTISKVKKTLPPTYNIVDEKKEIVKGSFYKQELQKVTTSPNKLYKIEKVIRRRGRGKKAEFLVKWEGYPDSHNSWVSSNAIKRI